MAEHVSSVFWRGADNPNCDNSGMIGDRYGPFWELFWEMSQQVATNLNRCMQEINMPLVQCINYHEFFNGPGFVYLFTVFRAARGRKCSILTAFNSMIAVFAKSCK